jgi:hypothetical protein
MLYRTIGENRICITQPTHAWVSGQMAQVWGNEMFGSVAPVEQVPSATGETTLTLMPINDDPTQLWVDPWCFQPDQVTVVFEGRILTQKANDEQTMHEQLANAPWVTLTATLRPR